MDALKVLISNLAVYDLLTYLSFSLVQIRKGDPAAAVKKFRNVGLVGSHAYSVLDVREVPRDQTPAPQVGVSERQMQLQQYKPVCLVGDIALFRRQRW